MSSAASAKGKKLKVDKSLILSKYVGKWYEIARTPNWFERNCASDVCAEYELLSDAQIKVTNSCKKRDGKIQIAQGTAKVSDDPEVSLRVTFAPGFARILPFVWGDYSVISVDENYRHALVGEPSRRYLWILSRDKKMEQGSLDALIKEGKDQGFDVSRLIVNDSAN